MLTLSSISLWTRVFLVSVLTTTLTHTPLKCSCPIRKSKHERPAYLIYHMEYILIIGTFPPGLVCNMEWDYFFRVMLPLRRRISRRLSVITQMLSAWMVIMQLITIIGPWHIYSYAGDSCSTQWFPKQIMQVIWVLSYFKEVCTCVAHMRVLFGSFPEAEADCTKALGLDKKVS